MTHTKAATVVVSMTTTPARLPFVHRAIQSILSGVLVPSEFYLCLSRDIGVSDFLDELPVTIFRTDDVGPATKLLSTLALYRDDPDRLIVTADDDVRYPPEWLYRMRLASIESPDCVVCYRARRLQYRPDGSLGPYESWPVIRYDTLPANDLLPLGVDGVGYRPRNFRVAVHDLQRMNATSPLNDDLWFYSQLTAPVRVVRQSGKSRYFRIPGKRLSQQNVLGGENDRAIARLGLATRPPVA